MGCVMGLDMFLYVEKYVNRKDYNKEVGEYDFADNPAFKEIVNTLNADNLIATNDWAGLRVTFTVGYWRKANQIHNWIVDNCADGKDECQRIYIPKNKAEMLVRICKRVLANPKLAPELLPPKPGFFFGSLAIDDYYFEDLTKTIDIFNKVLESSEAENIYYEASW